MPPVMTACNLVMTLKAHTAVEGLLHSMCNLNHHILGLVGPAHTQFVHDTK